MYVLKTANARSVFVKNSFLLILSLFSLCFCIAFVSCAFESESVDDIEAYKAEQASILWRKVNSTSECDLVFLGNSLTYFGNFESEFSEYNCRNLGIAGDTIDDILNRTDMVYQLSPTKLFLLAGTNSLRATGENVSLCITRYEVLLKELKTNLPNTEIYLENVLPTSIAHGEYVSNAAIDEFNVKVQNLARKYGLVYIDLNSLYRDENGLKLSCTSDGLHITASAYAVWYEKIREYL